MPDRSTKRDGGDEVIMKTGQLRVAVFFLAFTALSILYLMANDQLGHLQVLILFQDKFSSPKTEPDWKREYLVRGPNCRIRNSDPFDVSIQEYLAPTSPVVCTTLPHLSKIQATPNNHMLIIDQSVVYKYKLYRSHHIECCYSVITRVNQNVDNFNEDADKKYKVHQCDKINGKLVLNKTIEFLFVRCQSIPKNKKKGKIVYENMHAIIPQKMPKFIPEINNNNNIEKLLPHNYSDIFKTERLNVLILGIDSISRLSLRRTMPSTLQYLQNTGWLELEGYNKIADNTFPNLMAILAGKTPEQVHEECMTGTNPMMDTCSSLWKDYQKEGYLTAYAEDVPSLATFNYRMTGFVEQPTDYYMRPFMLAAHNLLPTKNKDGLPICVGPQSAAHLIFQYAKDFATTLHSSNKYFGLFWLNSFSHNDVNAPAALDLRLLNLLKELKDTGTYNNTVVIILSDHGIRFGKIRNSFLGYLEERLPFIFFHFPQWFIDKYPSSYDNLIINKNRLTSPYDVHATLKHFIGNQEYPPVGCSKCKSLLEEIPNDRKCEDAGIDPHWCTCSDFQEVASSDGLVMKVGDFLFNRVLNRTRDLIKAEKGKRDLCEERTMKGIIRVHKSVSFTEEENSDKEVYVIVIETEPYALFEATVQVKFVTDGSLFELLGFISRLDSYFSTTKCVKSKLLQFYCHCSI